MYTTHMLLKMTEKEKLWRQTDRKESKNEAVRKKGGEWKGKGVIEDQRKGWSFLWMF